MKISPARIAAFEILSKIENEQAFSSELLPLYEKNLSDNDRSLCHNLTLGVLRKQILIDRIIDHFVGEKRIDSSIRITLRLGIYQLLFLSKVPDYSAVNESVNLAQYAKKTSAKGLVNAVLRRATRETYVPDFVDEIDRISVETSHPRWLIERWISRYGVAETEKLATANNEIPANAFRLTSESSKSKRFEDAVASEYVEGCFISRGGTAELLAAAEANEIYFQDQGSQMVAAAVELKQNAAFLDLCAAPGSKFTQIAECSATTSRILVAGDLHARRVGFLRENCKNQRLRNVNILQYDAESSVPFADESFDTILIDAPCSGTGTIRHNPEIRYSLEQTDFAELAKKQLSLLENASKLLRTGGNLIYSTCSLESEENEHVCDEFLAKSPEFIKAKPKVPGRFLDADGFARTLPYRDNMDGFFIASFEKIRPA
ncbi:MAG: 16S rRNA (cytosine(967)-C(5))-methyltransferase RsmB [Pyrinomonadaceae bacterium]